MKEKISGWNSVKKGYSDPLIMDWYHIFQAYILFMLGYHKKRVVFDYFVRKTLPYSSYQLVAGIEEVLKRLSVLKFSKKDVKDLQRKFQEKGIALPDGFIEYLKNFRFHGNVWGFREGEAAFPNEPIIRVEGEFLEVFIIESMLLSRMNYASGVATKASRIVKAARGKAIAEFALRRSPNDEISTRSAMIGGFDSTSNVRASIDLDIPISGTSAHALVQALTVLLGSEREAQKIIAKYTDFLLVDTFDIEEGIKIVISVAKELERKLSIRFDSGSLIYWAMQARKLDEEGWLGKELLSSDLEEAKINEIEKSGAEVDGYGVGTMVANIWPPVGGVYKIVAIEKDGELVPSIKISGDEVKILLPGRKNVWRKIDAEGNFAGDLISLESEASPGENYELVLRQAMDGGKIIIPYLNVLEIREFAKERLAKLPEKYSRIEDFEKYPVVVSPKLAELKRELIEKNRR